MTALVHALDRNEAQALTDDIRNHAAAAWTLLIRAHNGKAWKALGYASWAEYVGAEFNMSRGRSYQILDQARVIQEIEAAVSTKVDISEREARDLKADLPAVIDQAREAVDALPHDATDDDKRDAVKAAIQEVRPVVSLKTKETVETTETYDAQTGEVFYATARLRQAEEQGEVVKLTGPNSVSSPGEAILAAAESTQAVQDARYLASFTRALAAAGQLYPFDAERLGTIVSHDELRAIRDHANWVEGFTKTIERRASGLRVIQGGKQ